MARIEGTPQPICRKQNVLSRKYWDNIFVSVVQNSASRNQRVVGPMQQIADWLEKLGLGQYALRFAENGIDLSVVSELTDEDFDRLGVLLNLGLGNTRCALPRMGLILASFPN